MTSFKRALALLLPCFLASLSAAQIQQGPFSNIIIIVQENRTPDNLFGAWAAGPCALNQPPIQGADLDNGANNGTKRLSLCDLSQPMNNGKVNGVPFDPRHQFEDWTTDYDDGGMDGFCHGSNFQYIACPTAPPSPYSYVQPSDVQPYLDIATTYGFANYMFQTNEGPSFEAHQVLFTGTAAPVAPNDPREDYHWDFVQDNATFSDSGCPVTSNTPGWIQPDRTPKSPDPLSSECYTHDSLVTSSSCTNFVCDKAVTWRYYAPNAGVIWDAPGAIPEVCYGENDTKEVPHACGKVNGGAEWGHMSFYTGALQGAPIFNDIKNCKLQQISWVIPDIAWSDHPGFDSTVDPPYGPSWVGDIVDAIGDSYVNSDQLCDYWGTHPPGRSPSAHRDLHRVGRLGRILRPCCPDQCLDRNLLGQL